MVPIICIVSIYLVLCSFQGVEGARPPALYVFGDSYADTGNHDKQNPQLWQPWKTPYGHTWPGNPSGRFSDGFVLTDFIAKFLNLPSPLPFSQVVELPATGANFAYGGSGVFFTYGPEYTNISAQIDQFEQLAKGKPVDYANSVVLFVYGGNDYSVHIQKHGVRVRYVHSCIDGGGASMKCDFEMKGMATLLTPHWIITLYNMLVQGIPFLITRVVRQLSSLLARLHKLGFRRFAVTNIEPAGCLPFIRMPRSMINCSRTDNVLSSVHNRLLSQSLISLRTFRGRRSRYILLDQYKSFLGIFNSGATYGFGAGLLESCCVGMMKGAGCGSVDKSGKPLYKICDDSSKTFFWDGVHPTQAGWEAVSRNYKTLFDSLG